MFKSTLTDARSQTRRPEKSRRRVTLECILNTSKRAGTIGHHGGAFWTSAFWYVNGELRYTAHVYLAVAEVDIDEGTSSFTW